MRFVTLADGRQFEIYRCGAADGVLWIGLVGKTVAEAEDIFADKDATQTIVSGYAFPGFEATFEGYTEWLLARTEEKGVLVAMRKEQSNATN